MFEVVAVNNHSDLSLKTIIQHYHSDKITLFNIMNFPSNQSSFVQINSSVPNITNNENRNSRGFMIYDRPKQEQRKKKTRERCKPTKSGSGLSVFTFLNFVISSISIAVNLISNSNNNNNNDNNNNNNNNNNIGMYFYNGV